MELGFFTMPIHPLDKDWRKSLKEDREAFLLADELGFKEAYVGEHVTDQAENITNCMMFVASLAAGCAAPKAPPAITPALAVSPQQAGGAVTPTGRIILAIGTVAGFETLLPTTIRAPTSLHDSSS